jgi:hypothetical protein
VLEEHLVQRPQPSSYLSRAIRGIARERSDGTAATPWRHDEVAAGLGATPGNAALPGVGYRPGRQVCDAAYPVSTGSTRPDPRARPARHPGAPARKARAYAAGASHSLSLDQRRPASPPRTAIASARRWPTTTTSRLPRVTPV